MLLRMHATEAESEGLATFAGGIGSMLPMQPYIDRVYAQDYILIIHVFILPVFTYPQSRFSITSFTTVTGSVLSASTTLMEMVPISS